MSELHELTALDQGQAIRRGEVDPVELVDHYLARIDAHNETVGAYLTVTPELARAGAAEARERLSREELGPLFGVPIAIKDLHPTAGVRTTYGSATMSEHVPPIDGHAVGLVRASGMPLLGKTNAPEFGPVCFTANDLMGDARNPYDLTRSASGSSGGAAAATAAGLTPIAHGSDGAGSIRTPASATGLVGFKPTRSRVGGLAPDWVGLSIEGPLARTVADAAALLDIMAVPAPGELHEPAPLPAGATFLGAVREAQRRPGAPLKIARFTDPAIGEPAHPDAVAAVETASAILDGLGHDIVDIDNPFGAATGALDILDSYIDLFAGAVALASTLVPSELHGKFRPITRYLLAHAAGRGLVDLAASQTRLAMMTSAALAALAPYDVVLSPTANGPSTPCGYFADSEDGRAEYVKMLSWSAYPPLANLTGQPSISLPLYADPTGLPTGAMLTARVGADADLLALAAQIEQAAPWADRHPPIWTPTV